MQGFNTGTGFPTFIDLLSLRDDPHAPSASLPPAATAPATTSASRPSSPTACTRKGYLLGAGGLFSHYSFGFSGDATQSALFAGASVRTTAATTARRSRALGLDSHQRLSPASRACRAIRRPATSWPPTTGRPRDKEYRGWDGRFGMLYKKLKNLVGISVSFKVPSSQRGDRGHLHQRPGDGRLQRSWWLRGVRTTNTYHFKPPTEMTVGAVTNLCSPHRHRTGPGRGLRRDEDHLRHRVGPGRGADQQARIKDNYCRR